MDMNSEFDLRGERSEKPILPNTNDYGPVANDLCEQALTDARSHLHPLLQSAGLDRLNGREEFLQAFKSALEQRIARKLAGWYPGVQAVFKFDETLIQNTSDWDGSIHLLVKVPRLSSAIKSLGKKLDKSLLGALKQLPWQRFQMCQSVLEIQQVTLNELRHGVGYGAMFCAVYSVPSKVWPQDGQAR